MAPENIACQVEGCDQLVDARGYCKSHYMRFIRYGNPSILKRKKTVKGHVCTIKECALPVRAKGLCNKHYLKFREYGDPQVKKRSDHGEPRRWLERHADMDSDRCLIWPFACNSKGYALFNYGYGKWSASRFMCTLVHGNPKSDDLECCHNCGKGHLGCVNPKHLRWDTHQANIDDKYLHLATRESPPMTKQG